LFKSLAGFALEVGDRLLINEEEVIFKGWVDQSQTAIEVKVFDKESLVIKKIFAKEIKSLARSHQDVRENPDSPSTAQGNRQQSNSSKTQEADIQNNPKVTEHKFTDYKDHSSDESLGSKESSDDSFESDFEAATEPNYNAWEVWTYLERQRIKTLKLLNTFQAEWEANRFVREAERSTPPNLRVHYEVRPIVLSEAETKAANQSPEQADDNRTDYADAIDVEVVTESL